MSTRAAYTFSDEFETFNVYKHHDGYPSGAYEAICNALNHSWALPRFEADDFAAAFVAGNKPSIEELQVRHSSFTVADAKRAVGGGVRLLPSGKWNEVCPLDIAYLYEVSCQNDELYVAAFQISCDWVKQEIGRKKIFEGNFDKFRSFCNDDCN